MMNMRLTKEQFYLNSHLKGIMDDYFEHFDSYEVYKICYGDLDFIEALLITIDRYATEFETIEALTTFIKTHKTEINNRAVKDGGYYLKNTNPLSQSAYTRRYAGVSKKAINQSLSTKALAADTSTKKKITDYCIIDHMGALESEEIMKQAYTMAYSLTQFPKMTYTMKKLVQAGVPYAVNEISNKQRNMIRFNKHPKQVIVICSSLNTTTQWYIDIWAEKVNNLTVILCEEDHTPELIDLKDLHPEWYVAHESVDSVYRRCANIWANALGWSFSAPLYRDTVGGMNEGYHTRNKCDFNENLRKSLEFKGVAEHDIKEAIAKEHERCRQNADDTNKTSYSYIIDKNGNRKEERRYKDDAKDLMLHESKISSRPSTFIKTTAVASEEECIRFFEYYRYLQQSGLLAQCLEPGYEICPQCGRPIRDTAEDCNYCTMHREVDHEEFETYFDDTYEDEE